MKGLVYYTRMVKFYKFVDQSMKIIDFLEHSMHVVIGVPKNCTLYVLKDYEIVKGIQSIM